jgi:hypothetical protein
VPVNRASGALVTQARSVSIGGMLYRHERKTTERTFEALSVNSVLHAPCLSG